MARGLFPIKSACDQRILSFFQHFLNIFKVFSAAVRFL